MDSEFHKRVILDSIFNDTSSLIPLSIVLPEDKSRQYRPYPVYFGVHCLATECYLSIRHNKHAQIFAYFDAEGNRLNTPIADGIAFAFISCEIGVWCEKLAEGKMVQLAQVDDPFVYRDEQFENFERIAMKFPAYEAMLQGRAWTELFPPGEELVKELDNELIRLRRMLI